MRGGVDDVEEWNSPTSDWSSSIRFAITSESAIGRFTAQGSAVGRC